MAGKAYYVNDIYQSSGRNPRGVRPINPEWIPIKEDAEPIAGPDEVVVRDHIRKDGFHVIRKRTRAMTDQEKARRDAGTAKRDEDALWQARIPLFQSGDSTSRNDKQAIAHILRRLHPR